MNPQPNIRPPVGSLAEYMQQITEITCAARNNPTQVLFYRGHADNTWKLEPTVYRIHPDGKSYRGVEFQLYQEMLRRSPQAFQDCNTTFERLVKMQHYGLPTRLLDLTQSPLVALYFVCCEKNECDGEVLILKIKKDDIYFQENLPFNTLAEFNFRFSQDKLLNDILVKYFDNLHEFNKNIENFNIQDADLVLKTKRNIIKLEAACIKALYNSVLKKDFNLYKRLMRLTDIFIISLRKFIKISLDSNNLEFSGKMWNTDEEIFEFISKKYNIDVANEKSITIFLKNYSRKIITYPPLNNERIQRQCGAFICFPRYHYREKKSNFPTKHITIAADKKQAILDELKTMGITRAYLFPELDVQADDIKNNLFPRS